MNRIGRYTATFGAVALLTLLPAFAAEAGLKTYVFYNPSTKLTFLRWIFDYYYPDEATSPPTGRCKGQLPQTAGPIPPGYTSPAAPFADRHWTYANSRASATTSAISPGCSSPSPGCPGCNQVDHAPLAGFVGLNAFDSYLGNIEVSTHPISGVPKGKVWVLVKGNCIGGGERLQTTADSDSSFASDSMSFQITKQLVGADSTVTLTDFSGLLRSNPGPGQADITNTYIVAVYPDSAAAEADAHDLGSGALFYGRVIVTAAGRLATHGFSNDDFTATRNPDGSIVVTPRPGLTKSVVVPNLTNAVVTIVADPWSHRPAGPSGVPGVAPMGAVILSAMLLTGGWWFVHRRRSAVSA